MSVRAILVADDERHLRSALFTALTRLGHAVELAENGQEALNKFQAQKFDLVITDLRMPSVDGLGVLKAVKKLSPATPVIMMTAYGSVETAVEAMREGAQDFILKPFPAGVIEEAVNRALSGQAGEAAQEPAVQAKSGAAPGERPIITRNARMNKLLELARSVAASPATVLLQGESGTGKELLARYIHQHSPRANGPFVALNCASLPESLLESELFGHEKGAFTGAVTRKQGKFELADGGTILLDEISEMDVSLQAKLLRVLQEGEIDRVGGKEPQKIDVRVIATTNRNLKQWVDAGHFRADLYYRLNVIPFYIPSLKERIDDVPMLADHFRNKYAVMNHKNVKSLSDAALAALGNYDWPGNIRELENTVARGVLLASGTAVEPHDLFMDEAGFMAALERNVAPAAPVAEAVAPESGAGDDTLFSGLDSPAMENAPPVADSPFAQGVLMTIEEMERRLIGRALNETDGNRTHAAKILGISVRTLRNKLAEYRVSA
ncbi:MAG: sigma-54 dependent transcriptional regulator [Candidatus Adiutrix sp.]|jgi:two-component system response regulator FlrC|nr:sigma-54 dependent transcriptional regulator [Candidatus Adiutrix sp.]